MADAGVFDTHTHLQDARFNPDRDRVLERARKAGVYQLLTVGVDFESSLEGVRWAEGRDGVYCSVGFSPHEARKSTPSLLDRLEELTQKEKVVAWGEVGLDYHYDLSPRDVQRAVFRDQVEIATRRNLPLIIHFRDAGDDLFPILTETGVPTSGGVMHCFTGNAEELGQALDIGLHISYSGIVTFPKARSLFEPLIRNTPPERLLVETDCPYLAPHPYRGKRCEPAMVVETVRRVAEILDETYDWTRERLTANAKRLFNCL
jgi:TatD DNase family protein